MKKIRRKTKRQRAILKADKAFGDYIKARDHYTCVLCGTKNNPTVGHLITRGKYSVRWDEENAFCQCKGCNFRHEYQPEQFTSWYINRFGKEKYIELVLKSNQIKKFKTFEIEEIAEKYKNKLKELEAKRDGKN